MSTILLHKGHNVFCLSDTLCQRLCWLVTSKNVAPGVKFHLQLRGGHTLMLALTLKWRKPQNSPYEASSENNSLSACFILNWSLRKHYGWSYGYDREIGTQDTRLEISSPASKSQPECGKIIHFPFNLSLPSVLQGYFLLSPTLHTVVQPHILYGCD